MKLSARRIPAALLAVSTCLATAAAAAAQGTAGAWRCGSNSYTDQPCEGGRTVAADDSRSSAQQREADAATHRNRAAAERMEGERLRQERLTAGRQVTYITKPQSEATAPARSDTPRRRKGRREPEHFTAAGAAVAKKK